MNWNKIGNIFNPLDYELTNNCKEFAQSPQVLVFDNFIRIYFSTRETDDTGKFLSHILYVDMSKDFKVINLSEKSVIDLGELGTYDEHGIFPLNILKCENQIFGYISGWSRRKSVSVETSIGLSESKDNGKSFIRKGNGPILSSSLNEPFLVGDPFVKKYKGLFYMWYIYGERWLNSEKDPQRVYKITYATSSDGVNWNKTNKKIITDSLNIDECQALPTVIEYNNKYHMIFCYREATDFRKNKKRGYRLGYATSKDLIEWKREDEKLGISLSTKGWDSEMMAYPHLFKMDNQIYLLYNGNEFGRKGFGIAKLLD